MNAHGNRKIAVFGAYGHTGRFVVDELRRRGWETILAGRDAEKLRRLDAALGAGPGFELRAAGVDDPGALDRMLAGAAAVLHCAGPFLDTSQAVLEAALRAGVHYFDVAAEQPPVMSAFENYGDAARAAGIVVMPAVAFYGGLVDLLATVAMSDWAEADDVSVAIALDSWQPTLGTRITGERNTGPRFVVSRGALQTLTSPAQERRWVFPDPFGAQETVALGLADVVLMSRHLKAPEIVVVLNRGPLSDLDDPATPPPSPADSSGKSAQVFLIDARVTRRGEVRRAVARGRDIYAITAPVLVEAAERVLEGGVPAGVWAPGRVFDAGDFLRALSPAHLTLELS